MFAPSWFQRCSDFVGMATPISLPLPPPLPAGVGVQPVAISATDNSITAANRMDKILFMRKPPSNKSLFYSMFYTCTTFILKDYWKFFSGYIYELLYIFILYCDIEDKYSKFLILKKEW
jgi:hypothetical protein